MKGVEMAEDKRKGRSTRGRQKVAPTSATERDRAMQKLMTAPVIEPETFAVIFDCGLQRALAEAADGRYGAIRLGRLFKFPSASVRTALGLPAVLPAAPADKVAA